MSEAEVADVTLGRLGQYDAVAKLGSGGMADVYLAVNRGPFSDFRKLVVLKLLRANLSEDHEFVEMFMKEARISARLSHPNVVHTYSVGIEDGHYSIVMEYLEGTSLAVVLKRLRSRPVADRFPLLAALVQALGGLQYVHGLTDYDGTPLHLVHRDIKPANLYVTYDGQTKLLDFGIAKTLATDADQTGGFFKGTPRYAAPEALTPNGDVDHRADIYSVGVVLWEILAGQQLWSGASGMDVMRRAMDEPIPPVSSVAVGVPRELEAICERAIARRPEDRYASVAQLKTALVEALAALHIVHSSERLGELMEKLFGADRSRRAQQIHALVHGKTTEQSVRAPDEIPTLAGGTCTETLPNAPRGVRYATGLMAVAVASGGIYMLTRPEPPQAARTPVVVSEPLPATPVPTVAVPPTPPPVEPTEPVEVSIRLSASPSGAALVLDDETLSCNPCELSRGGDDRPHRVEARLAGHTSQTGTIAFDEGAQLHLRLEPVPRRPPKSGARRPQPAPSAPASKPRPSSETSRGLVIDRKNPYE